MRSEVRRRVLYRRINHAISETTALTSTRCHVEYWNGKVKEMEMEMELRRRSGSVLYDRQGGNLRDTL